MAKSIFFMSEGWWRPLKKPWVSSLTVFFFVICYLRFHQFSNLFVHYHFAWSLLFPKEFLFDQENLFDRHFWQVCKKSARKEKKMFSCWHPKQNWLVCGRDEHIWLKINEPRKRKKITLDFIILWFSIVYCFILARLEGIKKIKMYKIGKTTKNQK